MIYYQGVSFETMKTACVKHSERTNYFTVCVTFKGCPVKPD